jgi:hypothetical protein
MVRATAVAPKPIAVPHAEAVRQPQIRVAGHPGFAGILGPGYPDHNDHTHVDGRAGLTGGLDPLGDN